MEQWIWNDGKYIWIICYIEFSECECVDAKIKLKANCGNATADDGSHDFCPPVIKRCLIPFHTMHHATTNISCTKTNSKMQQNRQDIAHYIVICHQVHNKLHTIVNGIFHTLPPPPKDAHYMVCSKDNGQDLRCIWWYIIGNIHCKFALLCERCPCTLTLETNGRVY